MSKYLRLLISGTLLAWLALRADWLQVRQIFAHLRIELWLAAVLLYLVTQMVSAVRWQCLARPLGFERPLRQFIGMYYIGMYFNLLLPTSVGGDVVRAWYLDGQSGRYEAALFSVLIDRLSGLVLLLVLASVAVLASPLPLDGQVVLGVWGTVGGIVLGFILLPQLARFQRLGAKYQKLGSDVRRSLALVFHPLNVFLSLFVQSANVVLVWLVGRAIDASIPDSYYWILVPMVTLATLLPSISGMGVREEATIRLLAPLGVAQSLALSLALLWFSVFAAASLCGGIVYLLGRFPRPKVTTDHETVRDNPDQGRARQLEAAA